MNPKISIVTVCYNAEKHIEEAVLSVINQEYDNKEYIIVDGGSSDSTLKIIEKYRKKIAVVISEPDKGISDAFNKGVLRATGDVIGICNADDFLVEGALNAIAKEYDGNHDIYRFKEIIFNPITGKRSLVSPTNVRRIPMQSNLLHMGCWIAKDAYVRYGLYDVNFRYCMDYELLRRFLYNGATQKFCSESVGLFRLGGVSQSGNPKIEKEKIEICRRYGGGVLGGFIWIYFERIKKIIKQIFKM